MSHPFRSVVLDRAGSTNTVAFEKARAGERGPLWVVARRQTEGRGRNGRQWASEPGNLYASLLLQLGCPLDVVHQLSLLTGVAVLEAIRAAARGDAIGSLRLKWPNDVLLDGAKVAGILPESQSSGAGLIVVVIGIGVNLTTHPAGIGTATDLAAHGLALSPEAMLASLDAAMARWLTAWDGGAGFARVRAGWLASAGSAGEGLKVNTGTEEIAGTFVDLDAGGALVLRDAAGATRTLRYGDVTLAPPAAKDRP